MAINLDAIKAKLNKLQSQTTKQNNLWKPDPGKQIVRIVPYQYNKENPFNELLFHYNLGKKNYLSPMTHGRPDPVAEFAEKLKASGNSDEWKLGKKLEPIMRTYVPVIVRGLESEGVKLWGFGKTVYQELLGFIADPDYGDITDPVNGRDIVVEFTPAEGGGYPKTSIRVKPNTSHVSDDKNILDKIVGDQPELTKIFKEPSYDDLKAALEAWLNPEDDQQVAGYNENNKPAESKSTTSEPVVSGVSNVDDVAGAFDELFNQ